jgi:hypothetical protein
MAELSKTSLYHGAYLDERSLVLDRLNTQYSAAVSGSIAYGSIAIRSAILLNSGALFLLPVYIRVLGDSALQGVFWVFGFFVVGALLGALAAMFAHNNFNTQIQRNHYENAMDVQNAHVRISGENQEQALEWAKEANRELRVEFDKLGRRMDRTMASAFGGAILSYLAFSGGCLLVLMHFTGGIGFGAQSNG